MSGIQLKRPKERRRWHQGSRYGVIYCIILSDTNSQCNRLQAAWTKDLTTTRMMMRWRRIMSGIQLKRPKKRRRWHQGSRYGEIHCIILSDTNAQCNRLQTTWTKDLMMTRMMMRWRRIMSGIQLKRPKERRRWHQGSRYGEIHCIILSDTNAPCNRLQMIWHPRQQQSRARRQRRSWPLNSLSTLSIYLKRQRRSTLESGIHVLLSVQSGRS